MELYTPLHLGENTSLTSQRREFMEVQAGLKRELGLSEERVSSAQQQIQTIRLTVQSLQNRMQLANTENESLSKRLDDKENKIQTMEKSLDQKQSEVKYLHEDFFYHADSIFLTKGVHKVFP